MRNILISILTFLNIALQLHCIESFKNVLPDDIYRRFTEEGCLEHTFKGTDSLILFPDLPVRDRIALDVNRVEPTVGVEFLLLYESDSSHADYARGAPHLSHLTIYNILRSVSTLRGIEYYSASRKRMRVFFHDAYVIDSPESAEKKEDPLVTEIPNTAVINAFLKDSSLGNYSAEISYLYYLDYFSMAIKNSSTIWQFIFPIVEPEDLNMFLLIIPCRGQFLFYGLAYVNVTDIFGLAQEKTASFYNRLKALVNWFKTSYEQKF